jgi:hypothetical protein
MEYYRLKREIVTGVIKEKLPTLFEVVKPLNWWLSNRIVSNTDDLELCDSKNLDEYNKLKSNKYSALKWWYNLTDKQKKDAEYHTFAFNDEWNGILTDDNIVKMFNDC